MSLANYNRKAYAVQAEEITFSDGATRLVCPVTGKTFFGAAGDFRVVHPDNSEEIMTAAAFADLYQAAP